MIARALLYEYGATTPPKTQPRLFNLSKGIVIYLAVIYNTENIPKDVVITNCCLNRITWSIFLDGKTSCMKRCIPGGN